MRKIHKEPPYYTEQREVTKFLMFPKRIGMETRWLERATWIEEYTEDGDWTHDVGEISLDCWVAVRFVTDTGEGK